MGFFISLSRGYDYESSILIYNFNNNDCLKWVNMQTYAVDEDVPPEQVDDKQSQSTPKANMGPSDAATSKAKVELVDPHQHQGPTTMESSSSSQQKNNANKSISSSKYYWSTGTGPRIGCVREYPTNLQLQALQHLHLSPRLTQNPDPNFINFPIPSPRPSSHLHLSPRLVQMGLPPPPN